MSGAARQRQTGFSFWLLTVILLTSFQDTQSQLCSYTGDGTINIPETDAPENPVGVPIPFPIISDISGGQITLIGKEAKDVAVLQQYDIQFVTNPFGQNEMIIGVEIDRDGATAAAGDDIDIIQFRLECSYTLPNGGTDRQFQDISLVVQDSNDNFPIFDGLPYSTSISEGKKPETTVYHLVTATDKDAYLNKELVFSLRPTEASFEGQTIFRLPNVGTGVIELQNSVDYERLIKSGSTQFELIVDVRDNSANPAERKTASATVTVTVTDDDDLDTTFYTPGCNNEVQDIDVHCNAMVYRGSITSGLTSGGAAIDLYPEIDGVVQADPVNLEAVDMDYLNTPIDFTIISSKPTNAKSAFRIVNDGVFPRTIDGVNERRFQRAHLEQIGSLLRSDAQEVTLTIRATQVDSNVKESEANIKLTVQPNNQNDPVLTIDNSGQGYIYENTFPGGNVFSNSLPPHENMMMRVTDPDLIGDDVQSYIYSIVENGIPFQVVIAGDRAYLVNLVELDRETSPTWQFTVQVTEDLPTGARSNSQQVTVTVLDRNDNTPTFLVANLTTEMTARDYSGNPVLLSDQIFAIDDDFNGSPNSQVVYSIEGVDVTTGSLTEAQVLGRIEMDANNHIYFNGVAPEGLSFVLTVKAQDQGQFPRFSTITLQVNVPGTDAAVSAPKVSSTSSLKAILDPVLYTFAALVVVGMTLALIYIKRKKVIKCYRETVKCFSRQTKDVPPHIYMYENSATLAESEQYVQSMNANLQVSENAYEKLQERSMNADHSYGELKSSCAGHMAPRTSTNTNLYDSEETATGDMLYEELQKQRMTDNHFYGDATESSVDMDTCIEASNSLENAGVYQPLQIQTGTTGRIYGELEGSDHCQMEHTTDNSENKSSVKAKTGQKKAYENLEVRP